MSFSARSVFAKQPNILLMVGDDVGFSDLGAYGGEIHTPNLDALAKAGTLFSNFHVTASCSPTRSMLMTGVDNHRNGLGNMSVTMPSEHKGKPGYDGVLNDKVATIAELVRGKGYHTYHIGKWHLGNAPEKRPYNRGFERTIALGDTGADNWEQRSYLPTYDKAHWYADGKEHKLPDDFYSSKYFVDKAIEFIGANKADGKPFFAYIGFQAVHLPLQAPANFVAKYHKAYQTGWGPVRQKRLKKAIELGLVPGDTELVHMKTTEDWNGLSAETRAYYARRMAVYAGMLDAMDFHIGRLVAYLKSTGQLENTVIIFISDNGPEPSDPLAIFPMSTWVKFNYSLEIDELGKKGTYTSLGPSWASAAASPGAFYKFFAGEGGVRVPLIVSSPGRLPRGKIEKSFSHIKDLAPTILELTGTPDHKGKFGDRAVEPITGLSLLPVLTGRQERTHALTEAIGYELSGNAALYKGDYKLLKNLPGLGDGKWHLYNIVRDPGESKDLQKRMPEKYQEMLADYKRYARENNVLDMPEGYDYIKNITWYTAKILFWRRLPYMLGVILVLAILVFWYRRRKR